MAVASVSLWAIPPGYTQPPIGWQMYLQMGGNTAGTHDFVSPSSGDDGGRFNGYISSTGYTTSSANLVNLWCVDYQMSWSFNGQYRTNVLDFNEIDDENETYDGPNSGPGFTASYTPTSLSNPWESPQHDYRDVRYEDVKNSNASSGDRFVTALPGSVSIPENAALFRYKMAAWLVMQYTDLYNPSNSFQNKAVQLAIWNTMNTSYDTDAPPSMNTSSSCNQNTSVSCKAYALYKQAALYVQDNFTSSVWDRWAVVSAWTSKNGDQEFVKNKGDKVQTFLVEITPVPEPGFFAALGIGTIGLLAVAHRRRRQAGAQS